MGGEGALLVLIFIATFLLLFSCEIYVDDPWIKLDVRPLFRVG